MQSNLILFIYLFIFSETKEQNATSVHKGKILNPLKNKNKSNSSVQQKKLSLTNGHQPDISTTLPNGHQICETSTMTNNFKMTNTTIHVSTKHKQMQPNEDGLQPPPPKKVIFFIYSLNFNSLVTFCKCRESLYSTAHKYLNKLFISNCLVLS